MTIFLLLVMDLLISLFIIFMDWIRTPKNTLQYVICPASWMGDPAISTKLENK